MKIRIATYNINSINVRTDDLIRLLKKEKIDILLLQEIKSTDVNFPTKVIGSLGYHCVFKGQKSYNGVAIVSKFKIEDTIYSLPNFPEDNQSRYIQSLININGTIVRIASVYVPNGGGEKMQYKLDFMDKLIKHSRNLIFDKIPTLFGGDYNIAIENIDVYDPEKMENKICFSIIERSKLREILNLGYKDSFRVLNKGISQFSWWDYRGNAYNLNKGLRIDYILTSPFLSDRLISSSVIENMMQSNRPSDHCPSLVVLEL